MYGYIRIGGVEMMDWKESGMAIKLVFFHIAVFVASFFYFMYTLVSNSEFYCLVNSFPLFAVSCALSISIRVNLLITLIFA